MRAMNCSGGQYITIDGFTFTPPAGSPFWKYGISFKSSPSTPASTWYYGNIVRNCTLNLRWSNSASDQAGSTLSDALGIFSSFQDGIQIYGNTVTGCYDTCIYTSNSARNYIVRNNICHDFGAQGIHNNGDASQGTGYPGIQYHALIADNILWNCTMSALGQVLSFDGVQNSVIENNLVYNAYSKGISLYAVDAAAGSQNNLVVNNTISTNATGGAALRIADDSAGNTVFNNILLSGNPGSGSVDMESGDMAGFTCDYNVVGNRFYSDGSTLSFSGWQGYGFDLHSPQATAAQLFINIASGTYLLKTGSPAIDAGIAAQAGMSAPTADLIGTPRPQGNGFDIGAYESGTGGSSGTATGAGTGASTAGSSTATGTSTTGSGTAVTATGSASGASTASGFGSGTGTASSGGSGGGSCGMGGAMGMALLLGCAGLLRCVSRPRARRSPASP